MPPKKGTQSLIDAVSSLKRAAHIENTPYPHDSVGKAVDMPGKEFCWAYTGSGESAEILANLLRQAFSQGHSPAYWSKHPNEGERAQIQVVEGEGFDWLVRFPASEATSKILAEKIEKLTQALIAPDRPSKDR